MPTLVHEDSYRRACLGYVHRARLKAIQRSLRGHVGSSARSWADFGCSNGFVIESVLAAGGIEFNRIVGFDDSVELLELARQKQIQNAEFQRINLNAVSPPHERFDLVTCFETLEHVADYRHAFENLFNHLADGGVLMIAVPNETGLSGLIKFGGRRLVQKNPYGDFFDGSSAAAYTWRLLTNGFIDDFRKPTQQGYGPHLGFDHRRLSAYIDENYVTNSRLTRIEARMTWLGMNVVSVFRRPEGTSRSGTSGGGGRES